jgi:hypothetical protein
VLVLADVPPSWSRLVLTGKAPSSSHKTLSFA